MRTSHLLLALAALALANARSLAADANGYTAQYECRAGNPNCNVDVAGLGNRACDQTITPSIPWSAIDWSNDTICIAAGDHTAKGTLTLGSSGTAPSPKVLRYYRPSDNNDEPWQQGSNQARIRKLEIGNAKYWVIQRLTFSDTTGDSNIKLFNASNSILNRIYIYGSGSPVLVDISRQDNNVSDSNTIQNSVMVDATPTPGTDIIGLSVCNATNTRIVNNEIRNTGSHNVQVAECALGVAGTIIENNDLYVSPTYYTDCSGSLTPSGNCAASEAILSFKDSGSQNNPVRVIHNRIWGTRHNDSAVGGDGASGSAISPVGGGTTDSRWYLFQNNIIADSQNAFEWTTWGGASAYNHSVVGNLIYGIQPFHASTTSAAFWWGGTGTMDKTEFYFNTIVDAAALFSLGNNSDLDFRGNVIVNTGSSGGAAGSGTTSANNAYYNAPRFGDSSELDIVRSTAAESHNVQYCYWRKLRTSPERVCVQYAMPTAASPHAHAADPSTGSRPGIGVNDVPPL